MSASYVSEPEGPDDLPVESASFQKDKRSRPTSRRGSPSRQPSCWRQAVVGYVAAVLLPVLAVLLTLVLRQVLSTIGFSSALLLLSAAFVGLTWGAGPSILATLLGAVLMDYFLLPPVSAFSLAGEDLTWIGIFVLAGLVISRLAHQSRRARKSAEALAGSLESERALLQATFEAIPDAVSFHNAEGALIYANQTAMQDFGDHDWPVILSGLPGFFHIRTPQGKPVPAEQLPIAHALRGETMTGVEVIMPGQDGRDRVLLTGAAPVRSRQGHIAGVVGISHDITALRQAEQEAEMHRRQLQALQTLTDTALTHLALEDLLRELLGRLRAVMGVDNAALLLLDENQQMLHMRAASGLEEAAENVHVPVGVGFAGRIAATRQPFIVENLSAFNAYNPFLKEKLHSVVGVPLMVGERILGVAHVGTATPRHFTDEEVQLLQRAADRIALALDRATLYANAQTARSEAEQHAGELEAMIEAMTDGVFIYGPQGETRVINAAARSMATLDTQDSVDSLTLHEQIQLIKAYDDQGRLLSEDQFPASRAARGETLDGAHAVDMRMHLQDGREIQLNCTAAPIRDNDGRQIGTVLVARDVTERRSLERRTEASLQVMLNMAQTLVEEPAVGEQNGFDLGIVARRLAELICQVVGGQRAGFFRFEPETELFLPVAVVGLSPEQEQDWLTNPLNRYHHGDNITSETFEYLASGGAVVIDMREPPFDRLPNPFLVQTVLIVPLKMGKHLVGMLTLDFGPEAHEFTPQEITLSEAVGKLGALVIERERLLREREEARASVLALREANRRMDEFLSIASHELRTPLTKIKTSIQLAEHRMKIAIHEEQDADSRLAKTLQQIQELIGRGVRSADTVNRLVGDLLDVSRIQSERLEIRPVPVDLIQVVCEAVEGERELFPSRTISLTVPEHRVPVIGDAERLAQVVINYLTNALKYSPPTRPVEVAAQVDEDTVRVSVRDYGPGIPPEEQQHLWERFYQASVAVQHGSSVGLGLGLYISKTIIELHGGQVGIESASGEGATFWFTLPLAEPRSL